MENPASQQVKAFIEIPSHLHDILTYLCSSFKDEWTLFGKSEMVEPGHFRLLDFRIPKQTNGPASTEIDQEVYADFYAKLWEDGENTGDWNIWIHSHNTMGCFWSATDYAQMENFGEEGAPYLLSIVVSTKGQKHGRADLLARLSVFKPVSMGVDIPTITSMDISQTPDFEAWTEELESKQTFKKYTPPSVNTYGGYYGGKKKDEIVTVEMLEEDYPKSYSLFPMDEDERRLVKETLENGGWTDEEKNEAITNKLNRYFYTIDHLYWFSTPFRELIVSEYDTSMHQVNKTIEEIFHTKPYDFSYSNSYDDNAPSGDL